MEPWITPSIFEAINQQLPGFNNTYPIIDEWTFWQFGGDAQGIDLDQFIKQHWDSWILEEHLATVAAAGITHLRIPVGYWLFDIRPDEPFINGSLMFPYALERLKTLCNVWAKNHNLKVLFDLHAAPGSQNGFDNSGRSGKIRLLEGNNLERTKVVVQKMSEWVRANVDPGVVFGIELLNEPNTFDGTVGSDMWAAMRDNFYPLGYSIARNATGNNAGVAVVLQTAFRSLSDFNGYMPEGQGFTNVWLDDHNYQSFGPMFNGWATQSNGWDLHINSTCSSGNQTYSDAPLWTFVGEFSLATTDCTKWLLGIGRSPTLTGWNRTDLCDYYSREAAYIDRDHRDFLARFAAAQMDAFEKANGWMFWTIRTEQSPEWDFLVGLREGWIPNPVGQRASVCA